MKRFFTTLFILALTFVSVFAQAPQKMSYQAVVRNANNSLVANQNVSVRISILQGTATGSVVYMETQTVTTNTNGLMTLSIGEGIEVSGTFSGIDWADGPYFLKSEIDPDGGVCYAIESVQQLLSVPYALYANEAGISFSGDYNDLTNTPAIPTVPTNVSAFTNDAGYITIDSIPVIPTVPSNVSAFTNDAGYITMDSIPTIPTVPANVSAFTNDAGYITMDSIPTIPTVPTMVSAFTNDAGYITMDSIPTIPTVPTEVSEFNNDANYITAADVPAQVNADWNATSGVAQILNKPALFSGDYNDLTNKPDPCECLTASEVQEMINNSIGSLQNKIDSLQSVIDSLGLIVDTSITHLGFHCGISTVTDHEGNVYATVQIGNQCWMRDNLRTTTSPSTGTYLIPSANTGYTYTGKQAFWYNNDSVTYATLNYGLLYNWNAAVDTFNTAYGETSVDSSSSNAVSVSFNGHRRGICPAGWHLPSVAEWTQLSDYVGARSEYTCDGDSNYIAKALASTEGWYTDTTEICAVGNDQSANNSTGFSAVPAGHCNGSSFGSVGYYTYFWLSTQNSSDNAYRSALHYSSADVYMNPYGKSPGRSVRCLRDYNGGGTAQTQPTVNTGEATNITSNSATLNGTVSNPDNITITAQGFEWKTTMDGNYMTVDASGETMSFNLTGLTANTDYSYRAFVTTAEGTNYGDVVSFTTTASPQDGQPCIGAATVTDVEGNTYNTVWIGEQCWMKENLRTRKYADNTPISLGTTASTTDAYRYYPNNDSSNVATYGYLYNWAAAMRGNGASSAIPSNVQGVCPDGWHLPSQGEWTQLTNYVKNKSEFRCENNANYYAKALASTTGWDSYATTCAVGNNPSDNNQTGFSAMPAGYFNSNTSAGFGKYAYSWSTTQYNATEVWIFTVYYYSAGASFLGYSKVNGFPVRCLQGAAGSVVVPPSVTTSAASEVTQTTAICGGDVTNDGGSPVTARGVCYGTSNNVTLDNSTHTVEGSGTGPFTSNLTGLTPGTAYRVRAYATNSEGTSYGEIKTFTTTYDTDGQPCPGAATVTDVDGNVYNTTMVGNVCWMKENLRTTKFSDGTPIALGSDTSSTVAYRYYPGFDSSNVATYGYLYNWSAFIHNQEGQTGNLQGICPAGWHIPKAEINQLVSYVSGQFVYLCGGDASNIAKAVASTEGWASSSSECSPGNNPTSNNVTGFSLPPAGFYRAGYTFSNLGQNAILWHANDNGTLYRWPYQLYSYSSKFAGAGGQSETLMKTYGHSVRCVRN